MVPLYITVYTYFVLFITGLCVGSFLNVLVDRLSNDEPITGRSKCDTCNRPLMWFELLPVMSYAIQGGKSRCCKKKLSYYYPFSEILTASLFMLSWKFFPTEFLEKIFPHLTRSLQTLDIFLTPEQVFLRILFIGMMCVLFVMFFADVKYYIIPDPMQVALGVLTFVMLMFGQDNIIFVLRRALDGIIIMAPLLAIYLITRGKGMGFGDVKLAINIGLLLGMVYGFVSLYIAFVIGAAFSVVLIILHRKKLKSKIPFGPFLIAGILITIFWYPEITEFLSKMYGI